MFNLEPSTGRKELQLKLNWPVPGKLYKVCKRKKFPCCSHFNDARNFPIIVLEIFKKETREYKQIHNLDRKLEKKTAKQSVIEEYFYFYQCL